MISSVCLLIQTLNKQIPVLSGSSEKQKEGDRYVSSYILGLLILHNRMSEFLIIDIGIRRPKSAGWTPRKASGIIQSKSKDLRTRGSSDINPSSRIREDTYSSNSEAEKRDKVLLPPLPFVLSRPSLHLH